MGDWNKDSLDGICNIVKGEQLNKLDLEKTGDYPCINGGIEPSGYTNKWNRLGYTITISEGGNSCGYVNFIKTKFWSGGHCYSLQNIKCSFNLDFLYYALKGNESKIMGLRVGSGLPNIQQKAIKSFEIQYPESKPEQTRIAEILTTADKAIAHSEALIAKYQRIKTGLMQDLLTKGIDQNGNIRSEATHQFKDSPLGRIPKEWECDKLISFCQKIQDGTHFSPKTDANGTFKYITSKNIRMGYLDLTNLEFVDEVSHNKIYKRCSVELGDVLLTKDGASTGNICINDLNEEFSLLSSVALIRGKLGILKNEFIFQFFMEKKGQMALIEQMAGNAITRITLSKINNTLIKVPPFHEQGLIIQRLKPLDELVNDEKTKLSKLQSLKTGLMQDLLSGKVRIKI